MEKKELKKQKKTRSYPSIFPGILAELPVSDLKTKKKPKKICIYLEDTYSGIKKEDSYVTLKKRT